MKLSRLLGVLLFAAVACSSDGGDDDDDDNDVGPGSWAPCSLDDECPSGEGCDSESGSLSPGYCTPLCQSDGDCPRGYSCPSGEKDQPGECDDQGEHNGAQGICDQFDGVYGPQTCG